MKNVDVITNRKNITTMTITKNTKEKLDLLKVVNSKYNDKLGLLDDIVNFIFKREDILAELGLTKYYNE